MSKFQLTVGNKTVIIEDEYIGNIESWPEIVEYFHKALIAMGFILDEKLLDIELAEQIENYNEVIDLDRPRHNRDII